MIKIDKFKLRIIEKQLSFKINEIKINMGNSIADEVYVSFQYQGTTFYHSTVIYHGAQNKMKEIKNYLEMKKMYYDDILKEFCANRKEIYEDVYDAMSKRAQQNNDESRYKYVFKTLGREYFKKDLRKFIDNYIEENFRTTYKEVYEYAMENFISHEEKEWL